MRKVKELQGNGFYVLEGVNAANTTFVQDQEEVDQFLVFVNSHFKNYMTIYDYCITPVGWNLLVKINNPQNVLRTYELTQNRRNRPLRHSKVWKIISNQVRMFRSRMTNWTNRKRKREGNASKTVYSRYIFETLEEGVSYIEKVRNRELNLDQPNPKYKVIDSHLSLDVDSPNLSSKSSQLSEKKQVVHLQCLRISDYVTRLLGNWIEQTFLKHSLIESNRKGVVLIL